MVLLRTLTALAACTDAAGFCGQEAALIHPRPGHGEGREFRVLSLPIPSVCSALLLSPPSHLPRQPAFSPGAPHTLEVLLIFFQMQHCTCFYSFSREALGGGSWQGGQYATLSELGKGLRTHLILQSSQCACEYHSSPGRSDGEGRTRKQGQGPVLFKAKEKCQI